MNTKLLLSSLTVITLAGAAGLAAADIPGPLAPDSSILVAGGTSTFSCNDDNNFAQFADLTLTFNLDAPTPVVIVYKLTGDIAFGGFLVTRVLIDGVEEPALRDITGNTDFYSNSGTWVRVLLAGSHTITVSYRTTTGCTNNPALATHSTRKLMAILYTGQ